MTRVAPLGRLQARAPEPGTRRPHAVGADGRSDLPARGLDGPSIRSTVVVFVLVPRGEQHDIGVANREQHDAPAVAEGNDQLAELPVTFGPTTGVGRKGEDPHRALHRVAEPEQTPVVRRVAGQFALDDVFLEALDVRLEADGGNNPVAPAHPVVRLALAATASRMRC